MKTQYTSVSFQMAGRHCDYSRMLGSNSLGNKIFVTKSLHTMCVWCQNKKMVEYLFLLILVSVIIHMDRGSLLGGGVVRAGRRAKVRTGEVFFGYFF